MQCVRDLYLAVQPFFGFPMKKELQEIIELMSELYGKDIAGYSEAFIAKTVEKRLREISVGTIADYLHQLSGDAREAHRFCSSLNITYSEFFRNRFTFGLLEHVILPRLVQQKQKCHPPEIRVWSAGCAAGQEAYSLAILLDELVLARGLNVSFRIFGTDISVAELARARAGAYDVKAIGNVSMRHIHTYFIQKDETFEVVPELRDRIDFSFYDLMDRSSICPPSSIYGDFDIVICGNLLLYYREEIHQFVLDKLRQCLSDEGFFVTGEAERAIIEQAGGFSAVAPPAPVYQLTKRRI